MVFHIVLELPFNFIDSGVIDEFLLSLVSDIWPILTYTIISRESVFILPPIHFQEYDWLKASACKPCIFDIRLVGRRGLSHTRLVVELRPFIFLIR